MKKIVSILLVVLMMLLPCALAEGKLVVQGGGTVYMPSDQVRITLGVNMSGTDMAKLQADVNTTINAIVASLEEAGIEKSAISTAYLYIYPVYNYDVTPEEIIGYRINNLLSIVTDDIENIGSYIDLAFEAGANTFDNIQFTAKDDSEAQKLALELAVKNAAGKAEIIAAASGKTLGDIIVIEDITQNNYYYYEETANGATAYAKATDAAAAVTTVRASQVSVSASVRIEYELN